MCASRPLVTDTMIGSGAGGLLITTFEMNRSFTTVRNTVTSNRVVREVHSAPTSNDVLRSGSRSGLPCVICVRPPTIVVVKPVNMIASAGMNARPAAKCARRPLTSSCLSPTLGLKTVKVLSEGVKLVLSGVSTVSVVMWSSRPPSSDDCSTASQLQRVLDSRRRPCVCCCRPRTAPTARPCARTSG